VDLRPEPPLLRPSASLHRANVLRVPLFYTSRVLARSDNRAVEVPVRASAALFAPRSIAFDSCQGVYTQANTRSEDRPQASHTIRLKEPLVGLALNLGEDLDVGLDPRTFQLVRQKLV
jgi:hypothetical protein